MQDAKNRCVIRRTTPAQPEGKHLPPNGGLCIRPSFPPVIGPKGSLVLPKGVIRAERHVHMGPKDAAYYGVKHLDRINMRVEGTCPTVLEGLLVRIHPEWKLEVHIDTDEANCCDLAHATAVTLFR